MESYRTEEEQVEALKKWWDENGRSTIAAIIVALGIGFGWQGWQTYQDTDAENASQRYQNLLQRLSSADADGVAEAAALAREIKSEHARSTYAQFAGLHLARMAVQQGDLATAETELRWVLGRAEQGSDTHQLAQLRLARVLASNDNPEQALSILDGADAGSYQSSYAVARGDILMLLERPDEARQAYSQALMLAGREEGGMVNLAMVQQKLQSLSPAPARELAPVAVPAVTTEASAEAASVEE